MITREELDQMFRLDPGVYVDQNEALHLVADELLEANGFEPTPENIERLEEELKVVAAAYGVEQVETLG